MPSKGSRKKRKEPTVTCPNCGALVPPALPECFICDERMPGASVIPPTEQPVAAAEPTKAEIESAEEAFKKLEEEIPLEEEILPWGSEAGAGEQLTEDRIIDLMLEFEREITPAPAKAEAEEPAEAEENAEQVEEAIASEVSLEVERRSYKGLAIASAGGLVYALSLILFVPLLGNIGAAVLIIPAALMIVGGSNIALQESASVDKAGKFSCPLCGRKLDMSLKECSNCGAMFSD